MSDFMATTSTDPVVSDADQKALDELRAGPFAKPTNGAPVEITAAAIEITAAAAAAAE